MDPAAPNQPPPLVPQPTRRSLRKRQSVPIQLGRFLVLNVRMVRMILKAHR
jgi:hypothetical protein